MWNYERLQEVNSKLKKIDQKGKPYITVNERIKGFRELCPTGTIITEIVRLEDGLCVVKATITEEDGNILSTGHAYEIEGTSFVNKTSYIENCETSAVGRALGMLGIGIEDSLSSYDEVRIAQTKQAKDAITWRAKLLAYCNENTIDLRAVSEEYGLSKGAPEKEYKRVLEALRNGK